MPRRLEAMVPNVAERLQFMYMRHEYRHHRSANKIDRDWSSINYNRIAFINAAITAISLRKGSCSYLEIGCDNNTTFDAISTASKVGVDPNRGGTLRMSSDEFFHSNKDEFDVIFIDGLHTYAQCHTDTKNALEILRPGGFVFHHDFIPTNWIMEHVPRLSTTWTGDVWKVAFELYNADWIKFMIADADHGIGITFKGGSQLRFQQDRAMETVGFDYFYDHYKTLPIGSAPEALKFISDSSSSNL